MRPESSAAIIEIAQSAFVTLDADGRVQEWNRRATELFGYSRFQPVNAMLAICGFLSLRFAVFNLLPIRPRDGSIAWGLLPALFKRPPAPPVRREPVGDRGDENARSPAHG